MLTKFDKALAALIVSGLVPILNHLFGWTLDGDIQAIAVTLLTGFFVWLVPNKAATDTAALKSILVALVCVGALGVLSACAKVTAGYTKLCEDELNGTYDTSGRGSCNDSDLDRLADKLFQ